MLRKHSLHSYPLLFSLYKYLRLFLLIVILHLHFSLFFSLKQEKEKETAAQTAKSSSILPPFSFKIFFSKMHSECGSPSLRSKIKSSICCFRTPRDRLGHYDDRQSRSPRSPYTWLKCQSHELEIKDKCRSLISRINGARNRKYHNSSDFRYDPLSYALNFEDDSNRDYDSPISFSARLPVSPDRSTDVPMVNAMPREIVAFS